MVHQFKNNGKSELLIRANSICFSTVRVNFNPQNPGMKSILAALLLTLVSSVTIAQTAPEGLFLNSKAPDFKAKDQNGKTVQLKDLRKKGKVVLVFYRGQWCPYCNRYLSQLSDSLQAIGELGATVVAVTPETPENVGKTVEKTKASFSILTDEGLKIMKAYDVEFDVPENTLARYKNTGLNIAENNGANGNVLPIPATYIIDKEGNITYRFFNADYKKRPSVAEILKNLQDKR